MYFEEPKKENKIPKNCILYNGEKICYKKSTICRDIKINSNTNKVECINLYYSNSNPIDIFFNKDISAGKYTIDNIIPKN